MTEQQATAWDDEASNEAVQNVASVTDSGPELDRAETGVSRRRNRGGGIASVVAVAAVVLLALAAALAPSVFPDGSVLEGDTLTVAASVIFAASYLALALGRVPGLSIDRAGIALVGACLMVASGALPLDDAYRAIDFNTITLLLGMMIVVANLRLSGFFGLANAWVARRARRPLVLLIAITGIAGVFSAFLVNDAICLVLAPLVLELTLSMGRKPVPYLLALAMGSNIVGHQRLLCAICVSRRTEPIGGNCPVPARASALMGKAMRSRRKGLSNGSIPRPSADPTVKAAVDYR